MTERVNSTSYNTKFITVISRKTSNRYARDDNDKTTSYRLLSDH